jgi:penicillin-binding protein 1A
LQKVGFEYAFTFAQEGLGLEHLVREYKMSNGTTKTDLGYSPLGMGALTVGASVREMSNAYATFANNGVWREARTYTKVYDSEGNLVLDNTQESRQVMGEKAINYLNYCLYNAANSGTGTAAVFPGMNIAGKTGTTSSNKDRWFCGYTPYYTAAVWCGYDKPEQIRLTGNSANPACRLWKKVMQPLHTGLEKKALYSGDKFSGYSICLDTGKIATEACNLDVRGGNHTSFGYCYSEDIKDIGYCDQHVIVDYCVTGGGVATDYCRKFEGVQIKKLSLVKRSKAEIDELKRARSCGLEATHTLDNYIWYTDGNWHGFSGYAQSDVSAPYITCPTHTKDSWKDYQEEQKKEEEATAPTEP